LIQKYEKEAGTAWDKFYSSHQTKFFKDRHYLVKSFPAEFGPLYAETDQCVSADSDCIIQGDFIVTEIGCGVGNTILPLLERPSTIIMPLLHGEMTSLSSPNQKQPSPVKKRLAVVCYDFSPIAIQLLQQDARFVQAHTEGRATAAVWDITSAPSHASLSSNLTLRSDISILFFCLSAISPEKMPLAAKHVADTLKPGGILLLRDYGRYDEAQLKLGTSRAKRLGDNFYVKHDGTRCYYFTLDDLEMLFSDGENGAGLEVLELKYLKRTYKNRAKAVTRRRVWVQARFRKHL